jgi:hypothetical protein
MTNNRGYLYLNKNGNYYVEYFKIAFEIDYLELHPDSIQKAKQLLLDVQKGSSTEVIYEIVDGKAKII